MGALAALVFSDIEGSTRLLQRLGPAYVDVLARHQRIIRSAIAAHGGAEQSTEGDSFFITFGSAASAVSAAFDAQRALAAEPWPPDGRVRVRIGIHVGEIEHTEAGIVGLSVHHAARVAAVAHGGQIVVSDAARNLAGEPPGVRWVPLGEHTLRDVGMVLLHQVAGEGLSLGFPPLRTTRRTRGNVPVPTSSLVGRDHETAETIQLLSAHRLVTLTGTGGCGKTRLAMNVAATIPGVEAVWFVELADLTDPGQVTGAVAATTGAEPTHESITGVLDVRPTLLVLDNCEHLLDPSRSIAESLLRSTVNARILTTSREPLGLPGEAVLRVPSLSVPAEYAPFEAIRAADAVQLFEARASQVREGFRITPADAGAVRSICARLDGIPLAIELAAARVRAMSPTEIDTRLADRFRLLTGRPNQSMGRQQTLQATVEWSYRLLTPLEQHVFARLAVLRNGFTLDDAVAVAGAGYDEFDLIDAVTALHDKSLIDTLPTPSSPTRFRLPETIAQFANGQLAHLDEHEHLRDRHAGHFRRVAARLMDGPEGMDARGWASEWVACSDNVYAAAEWLTIRSPREGIELMYDAYLLARWAEPLPDLDRLLELFASAAAHPGLDGTAEGAWAAAVASHTRSNASDARTWSDLAEARLTGAEAPVVRIGIQLLRIEYCDPDADPVSAEACEEVCRLADLTPGLLSRVEALVALSYFLPEPQRARYAAQAVALLRDSGLDEEAAAAEGWNLLRQMAAGYTEAQLQQVRALASTLGGSALLFQSWLDLLEAEYGDPRRAINLTAGYLPALQTAAGRRAGWVRNQALGIAAHVHRVAGALDTAADLAADVFAATPLETVHLYLSEALTLTTASACLRARGLPDRAGHLFATVAPRIHTRHSRLIDEAALVATEIDKWQIAARLLATADHHLDVNRIVRSPWQERQVQPLRKGTAAEPLTVDELAAALANLSRR